MGGIIASFLFLPKYSPRYLPGFGALVGFLSMSLIGSIAMTIFLRWENARRDGQNKSPKEYTMDERMLEREKGDNATFFRYVV